MAQRPRVAVLSVTRDRLEYTQHCFATLKKLAGHPYDHFVFDNGSQDGTPAWLNKHKFKGTVLSDHNVGISPAMNALLDLAGDYDVYVKVDNDCELTNENTLAEILSLLTDKLILSPKVLGLNSPPPIVSTEDRLGFPPHIGGIFMAVPGWVFKEFRFNAGNPTWGMDDVEICAWFANKGGRVAYVMDMAVNHYETTQGQWARFPDYFEQKKREGLPL